MRREQDCFADDLSRMRLSRLTLLGTPRRYSSRLIPSKLLLNRSEWVAPSRDHGEEAHKNVLISTQAARRVAGGTLPRPYHTLKQSRKVFPSHAPSFLPSVWPNASLFAEARSLGSAASWWHASVGSKNPYLIVSAMTAAQARDPTILDDLIQSAPYEAETIMLLMASCVAVCVAAPENWPPWVSCRLSPGKSPPRQGSLTWSHPSTMLCARDERESTPERVAAAAAFTALSKKLEQFLHRSKARLEESVREELGMLGFMAALCGLCFAPSCASAQRLCRELLYGAPAVPEEAVGCALEAYCHASSGLEKDAKGANSPEERWLQLWRRIKKSNTELDSKPTHSVGLALYVWMRSPAEETLQAHHMSWHLHCLVRTQRTGEVLVEFERYHAEGWTPRLRLDTARELLTVLPREMLDCKKGHTSIGRLLGERFAASIRNFAREQNHLRGVSLASFAHSGLTHPVSFLTSDIVLYARMMDHVLNTICAAKSGAEYELRMFDLQALFNLAVTDSLAASLVPAGKPIEAVMEATTDNHRARRIAVLVCSIRRVVGFLSRSGSEVEDGGALLGSVRESCAAAQRVVQLAVNLLSRLLVMCSSRGNALAHRSAEPKWRRRLREAVAVRTHKYQLLLSELPHADLSAIVQTLLNNGFVSEGGDLGWCLLDSEMVDLRFYSLFTLGLLYQALRVLAKDANPPPFACAQRLRAPPQISDIQNEQAHVADAKKDYAHNYNAVLTQLRILYKRRQDVFGEELIYDRASEKPAAVYSLVEFDNELSDSEPACEFGKIHYLPGLSAPVEHPLLLQRQRELARPVGLNVDWQLRGPNTVQDSRTRHLVHCLRNRSMITPEGKLVLDCRRRTFDGWKVKGTIATTT